MEPLWRRADELGLHAAYTYDHLSWRSFRDRPWFSMVPTLSAAAIATSRIRLGPLVTTPNFRHPVLLAKDLLSLDDISNGRLSIGVGAGGRGYDSTVLAQEPWSVQERHERFVEFTQALDRMLREPATTIDGVYYPVNDSRQIPGSLQKPRPPMLISALGPRGMSFAAEHGDGWITIGRRSTDTDHTTESAVRRQCRVVGEALESVGRSPDLFARLLLDGSDDERPLSSYDSFQDWAGRYHDAGITELVLHWPIANSIFDADQSIFERIVTDGRESIASW